MTVFKSENKPSSKVANAKPNLKVIKLAILRKDGTREVIYHG